MDNRKTIETIVSELIAMQPALRGKEHELRSVIAGLRSARPAVPFDEGFSDRLRSELLARAKSHTRQTAVPANNPLTITPMNKLFYALGGAALAIMLIVPAIYIITNPSSPARLSLQRAPAPGAGAVTPLRAGAFGKLMPQAGDSGASMRQEGGGGFGGGGFASPSAAPLVSQDAAVSASEMIAPDIMPYPAYTFKYEGEALDLPRGSMDVLRRVKGAFGSARLSQFLRTLNVGGFDLRALSDSALREATFMQNKDFGYAIYLNLADGFVSINQNWERWPQCDERGCPPPLTSNDMLPDERILQIAQAFVSEHGLNLNQYGSPEVLNEWRIWYAQLPENQRYIPDRVTVLYPLMIDGKNVYDEGGSKTGLRIDVDIRYSKVAAAMDFAATNYEASAYEAETDVAKILAVARRGGIYGWTGDGSPVVEIRLGEPAVEYMKFWHYRDGQGQELLAPALVFPVLEKPANEMYFRQNVIVPLVKDLLDQPQGGSITIMEKPVSQ